MKIFKAITGKAEKFTAQEQLYFSLMAAFREEYTVKDGWVIKTERVVLERNENSSELIKATVLKEGVVYAESFSEYREDVTAAERSAIMEALFCLGILPYDKTSPVTGESTN